VDLGGVVVDLQLKAAANGNEMLTATSRGRWQNGLAAAYT
jgi:hypothetical protein